jgi:hypothetical protein
MKRVCVFCGSSMGARPSYATAAHALGETLAARGLGLVYGGARVGLMGVVANAVLQAGGEVVGVLPSFLGAKEIAHDGLSELIVVESMHERKAKMAELADAFVALPGGFGTLEELAEVLTWAQLGLHGKPCALFDVDGYYAHLVAFADHASAELFVKPEHRRMLLVASSPDELLQALASYEPPAVPKWIDRDET